MKRRCYLLLVEWEELWSFNALNEIKKGGEGRVVVACLKRRRRR
jgi:hypothetical protein